MDYCMVLDQNHPSLPLFTEILRLLMEMVIDIKQLKKIKLNKGKGHVSSFSAPHAPSVSLQNEVFEDNTASIDPTLRLPSNTRDHSLVLHLPSSRSLRKRPRLIYEDDCVEVDTPALGCYFDPRPYLEKKYRTWPTIQTPPLSKFPDADVSFLEELDIKEIRSKARERADREVDDGEQTVATSKVTNVIPYLEDDLIEEGDLDEALD
ncbi:conserved hypothetical protein [Ricinus communis]|uniref:Uncharacterized protein n=1 Tax=Ricinus communis TaxID=3988 RepID=B9RHI1_RICCO|nr:conserved hypothetical protein [Ricinus communis]